MKTEKQTFADTLHRFQYKVDIRTAFDDFLTMSLCAFGQNLSTGKSYDEDLYLQTMAKYKEDPLRFEFPKLLACLSNEMTDRLDSGEGWDILGEFYEQHCSRKGLSQFFTPWPICTFMARSTCEAAQDNKGESKLLRILDPSCGSGRMLLASSRVAGPYQEYYGIDIDQTCVKMTALNLFLSGLLHTETMCGNALLPNDFHGSYKTSFLPFGVFRIQEKENSWLWHIMQTTLKPKTEQKSTSPKFETKFSQGPQLKFF